ncbi:hypothetical protein ACEWY4_021508 [Coilia grayii]|uniref:CCHC-type domain-containing protein n=1 Tax=Coilia grayii TaxID=363190 RepID=A0ABD1J974_9TELE
MDMDHAMEYDKWIRPLNKTVEEVSEILILEQYLRTLAPDIQVWVKERNPPDGQRAAELVENFMSARRGQKNFRLELQPRPAARGRSEGFGHGGGSRTAEPHKMPVRTFPPAKPRSDTERKPEGPIVCFYCKQEGHIKPDCPHRKPKYSTHSCIPRPGEGSIGFLGRLQTMPIAINGESVTALLDSGSTRTLVQPHLVERRDTIPGRKLKVLCVNGDEHEYPVADVYLDIQGQTYEVTVGVVERLSHPVVIGQDIVVLPELLQTTKPVNMDMTRAQSRVQASEETGETPELNHLRELAFADADITPPARVKSKKTRGQRRQAKLIGSVERDLPVSQSEEDWGEVPDNFGQLQREDDTLKGAFEQVSEEPSLSGEHYVVREGLLYHLLL